MPIPEPMITVLAHFQPLFTGPTWRKMMILLTDTLLAHGRRTVTAALRQTGRERDTHFSAFHQGLYRSQWSALAVSRQLLLLMVETFIQTGVSVAVAIDETLERRWGAKISTRGHYRDSALSSRERKVRNPGLRWIVMAVVVTLPWAKPRWALPLLGVLTTTPEVSPRLGKRHQTVGMWAQQMVSLLRRWLPIVPLKLIGDLAYSILELGLPCAAHHVTLIAPFRLDSVIHQPPKARTKQTIARPRVLGKRLPSLEQLLHDLKTAWQCITWDWYGEGKRALEIGTGTALCYRSGLTPVPIRWVLTRDPQGKRPRNPPSFQLLIQDTTEGDSQQHPTTTGLGPIGNGTHHGYLLQSVLAVLPGTRQVLGLAHQEPFLRQPARHSGKPSASASNASGSEPRLGTQCAGHRSAARRSAMDSRGGSLERYVPVPAGLEASALRLRGASGPGLLRGSAGGAGGRSPTEAVK